MINRVDQLESLIPAYAESYYSGQSEVSDEYFDGLVNELRNLKPDSEVLKKTGWGFEPDSNNKVDHRFGLHIGSLSKIHSVEEISESLRNTIIRISAKLDGLSVVSYYENGRLVQSVTRGNGRRGKDVTDKIIKICPRISTIKSDFTGAIRGEVILPQEVWEEKYIHLHDDPSCNPRNTAAGFMNRGYLSDDLENLKYVCYKVLHSTTTKFSNDIDGIAAFLHYNLFDVVPWTYVTSSKETTPQLFESLYKDWSLIYPCDGLVLTKLGRNLEYNEVAYKFQSESKQVVVTDVTYNATRTGRMAPRVWFDPVELSGAMVQKATGFNAKFIKDNCIGPGAVIEVCRSGEVIPDIMKVISTAESGEPKLPSFCPTCNTELKWDGVDLVCEHENESQLAYRFISVLGETDGVGWSLFNKILETYDIESLESLVKFIKLLNVSWKTTVDVIPGFISGSATQSKCIVVLDKLRNKVSPVSFLVACNIGGISWTTAKSLMENYADFIKDVKEVKVDWIKVSNIKGFGYNTVVALQSAESRIKTLAEVMTFEEVKYEDPVEAKFKVAITGSLSIKRADFDALLESRGISQSSNFKDIRYLITNNPNSGSSKMKKAKDNSVEIISEEKFTKMYLESEQR